MMALPILHAIEREREREREIQAYYCVVDDSLQL
jgi:hypothetical protein